VTAVSPPNHHAEPLQPAEFGLQGAMGKGGVPLQRPEVHGLLRMEDEVSDQARHSGRAQEAGQRTIRLPQTAPALPSQVRSDIGCHVLKNSTTIGAPQRHSLRCGPAGQD
jgi:hypothetical protein